MGCDIHVQVETRTNGRWTSMDVVLFDARNYGIYGFLADVRNYSHSPVIAEPRGLPDDADMDSDERDYALGADYHSHTWLALAELQAFDYDRVFWDRRVTKAGDGAALAEEGEGQHVSLREFLGPWFFHEIDRMATLGAPEDVRIVFWFDN
jgi:hypothetical protein